MVGILCNLFCVVFDVNVVEEDDFDFDVGWYFDDGLVLFGVFDEVFVYCVGGFVGVLVDVVCDNVGW